MDKVEMVRLFNVASKYPNFMKREVITFTYVGLDKVTKWTGRNLLTAIRNINKPSFTGE